MRISVCLILVRSLTAVDRLHQSFCLHLPQPDFDNFAVYITEEDITCIVAIKIWVYWISGLGAEKLCNPNFDGFFACRRKHHRSSKVTWHHCEECT